MGDRLAPDFRRFLPAWIAFATSVSLSVFVLAIPQSLRALVAPSGEIDDAPPMLVVMLGVFVYVAALAVGLVAVPFRRWFVGPRFPFLRRGYVAVACLPFVAWLLPDGTPADRAVMFVGFEIYMLLSAAFFVLLGRWFGAFGPEP